MNNRILLLTVALVLALSTFATTIKTDRTWYLAGEAMKVSVTAERQRVGASAGIDALIAYAELCDTYGLAAGVVVGLKNGKGSGIIELPSNLHSGYYVLSAYTRDKAQVSQQLVAIINPLHKSEDDDIKWVSGDSCWVVSEGTANLVNEKTVDVPETEGHIIKARIKNVYDGKTYRGSQICPSISIIGKQIHYFEGKMVNDSTAVFYTYDVYGKQPLVLSALSSDGVSLPIEMISPFATLLPKQLPHLVFHYKRSEVEARSMDMQRHQMAITPAEGDGENQSSGVPLDYDDTAYSTKPDLTYNLDEYRQFRTIREVLVEYVSNVSNRKVNGVTKLIVHSVKDHFDDSWPSLVLIDGMPVFNIERLLNYDARRIHYINVYGGQYTFGNGVYNGILSFITRSGRLTNYPVEPNMQYLVYDFPE